MARVLFEVWDSTSAADLEVGDERWSAQMVDYVAHFPSQKTAERYVAMVEAYRRKHDLK